MRVGSRRPELAGRVPVLAAGGSRFRWWRHPRRVPMPCHAHSSWCRRREARAVWTSARRIRPAFGAQESKGIGSPSGHARRGTWRGDDREPCPGGALRYGSRVEPESTATDESEGVLHDCRVRPAARCGSNDHMGRRRIREPRRDERRPASHALVLRRGLHRRRLQPVLSPAESERIRGPGPRALSAAERAAASPTRSLRGAASPSTSITKTPHWRAPPCPRPCDP
jgi:hypothetical protein